LAKTSHSLLLSKHYRRQLKESYIKRRKKVTSMRAQERINFMSGIEKQMRIKKDSDIINMVSQQTPEMNKGERNKQTILGSTR
jgi:hypothetical protein